MAKMRLGRLGKTGRSETVKTGRPEVGRMGQRQRVKNAHSEVGTTDRVADLGVLDLRDRGVMRRVAFVKRGLRGRGKTSRHGIGRTDRSELEKTGRRKIETTKRHGLEKTGPSAAKNAPTA